MAKKIGIAFVLVLLLGLGVFFVLPAHNVVTTIDTSQDAINAIGVSHPEFAGFATRTLPPSEIESKKIADGWLVGFITKGSGVPGVLEASCFYVSKNKNVEERGTFSRAENQVVDSVKLEDCTPVSITEVVVPVISPYGPVTVSVQESTQFSDFNFRVFSIEEENRCPSDVTCIQAGTVGVKVEVVSKLGTSTGIVKLGQTVSVDGARITFVSATPYPKSTAKITTADYKLTFTIEKVEPVATTPIEEPAPQPLGTCYVGGCSAQLCSDKPDMVSTCEYTATYACYKTATCERQASGQCGWTPTEKLTQCLAHPGDLE